MGRHDHWILLPILVLMVVGMTLGVISGYQPRLWHRRHTAILVGGHLHVAGAASSRR